MADDAAPSTEAGNGAKHSHGIGTRVSILWWAVSMVAAGTIGFLVHRTFTDIDDKNRDHSTAIQFLSASITSNRMHHDADSAELWKAVADLRATNQAHYEEILRRLERIEKKMDK